MDKYRAIQSFWESFGWDAFNAASVPDDAFNGREGYITYTVAIGPFDTVTSMTASLWQRSSSWAGVLSKAEDIETALTDGGRMLPYDGGVVWVKMGGNFAQTMGDVDDSVRRVYLMVEVECL